MSRAIPDNRGTARTGFTLVEILLAVCVALIVMSITVNVLMRQQRFYRGVDEILTLRSSVRDGMDILATDLRTASIIDTVKLASDTAVEFFSTIGASTLCADPAGNRLLLPPDTLVSGNVLTAWAAEPDTGDYVVVYHDSSSIAPVPGWRRFRIASVTRVAAATGCPPSSGFTTAGDVSGGALAYEISVVPSGVVAAGKGDPVRFIRQVRYSMYRAADGRWYLGYRRCGTVGCNTVQPVSGPYDIGSGSPLTLRYYRTDGALLRTPGTSVDIARIDVTMLAAAGRVPLPGFDPIHHARLRHRLGCAAEHAVMAGRNRRGFALLLALVAILIASALMIAVMYRVQADTSITRSVTLRRVAIIGAESAVWSTLATANATIIRSDPIGAVRKSTVVDGGVTTTVMLTRTDTTHVWIVADAAVRRGRMRARHRAGMSAIIPGDTMRTDLVPITRRAWAELF